MFNTESPFIESNQEKIDLHGVDRSAISDILKFMYSSNIDINENNVFILMEAANLFQIYALKASFYSVCSMLLYKTLIPHLNIIFLQTFISFYLQSSLTLENCLQFYIMASRHHYHDLATCALHFLLVNFSKIVENDEFLDLPFEILLEIISSKLLNIRNEENLLEVTWF